jgi:hypothetical protein
VSLTQVGRVAWSFSVIDSFETCAWRHYLTKVKKTVSEGQSPEMKEGLRVHKALEDRLVKKLPLQGVDRKYEPFAARIEKSGVGGRILPEQKLCLNDRFKPTTWFAKGPDGAWVRAISDVTILKPGKGFIGDWKTGKPKPNSAQLKLTAAMAFAIYPDVQTIWNAFLWLKTDTADIEKFERADAPGIWQEFMPRVRRLEIAFEKDEWPKKPSGLCREWCPVPRHLCEHSGKS